MSMSARHRRTELVISVYLKGMEIPSDIIRLLIIFIVPPLEIFGIGRNRSNLFGLNNPRWQKHHECDTWMKLDNLSNLCRDVSSIYIHNGRLLLRHLQRSVLIAGNDFEGDEFNTFSALNTLNKHPTLNDDEYIEVIGNGLASKICVLKTSKNRFYSLGALQPGNLQWDRFNDVFHPRNIIKICCGLQHILFLCDKGELFACGSNQKVQCGQSHDNYPDFISIPRKVQRSDEDIVIKDIAIGNEHNLCLSSKGKLFGFGQNINCQLAMHSRYYDRLSAVEWFKDMVCVQIECGGNHSVVITNDCMPYIFGNGKYGQCGNGSCLSRNEPIHTKKVGNIIDAAAGSVHTVLLNDKQQVFTFGGNESRQISASLRPIVSACLTPYLVSKEEIGMEQTMHITSVMASHCSTFIFAQ